MMRCHAQVQLRLSYDLRATRESHCLVLTIVLFENHNSSARCPCIADLVKHNIWSKILILDQGNYFQMSATYCLGRQSSVGKYQICCFTLWVSSHDSISFLQHFSFGDNWHAQAHARPVRFHVSTTAIPCKARLSRSQCMITGRQKSQQASTGHYYISTNTC